MWRIFVALLAALIACNAQNDVFHSIMCNDTRMSTSVLPADLALKLNYATTIRYTNWDTSETALITEKNFTDAHYVNRIDRAQTQTFILRPDSTVVFNDTSCTSYPTAALKPNFYPLHDLISANITKGSVTIAQIIDSILKTKFQVSNLIGTAVVGGIDAAAWVGCNFNVSGNTGIQVAVFYSGNKDQKQPYSKDFKNPVALSIHFSTFINASNTMNMTSHYSVDISGLEVVPEGEKDAITALPRGHYCENMALVDLPVHIPDRFGASIDFINTKTKQIDNIEIMYDSVLKVTHFAVDFNNDLDIPFVAGIKVPKTLLRASIYRDFNYGVQYVTSKDGRVCKAVQPLDASYGDCTVTDDKKVAMISAENILLNVTNVKYYHYGKQVLSGVEVETYITKGDEADGGHFVVEVNFIADGWTIEGIKGQLLHSIVHYHRDKNMELTHKTFIHFDSFQNYTALGPLWLKNNAHPCTVDAVEDNFFFVNLQNVSLANIQSYGTENVECALAEALSEAINISVFRISYFMFKEAGPATLACFIVGKKAQVTPTPTIYLKNELTVAEFKKVLNDTVVKTGLVAKLITEDLKPAAININRLGVINTDDHPIPPPSPSFVGYSGGSMFILGIFAFIFGAGISVGTYIFYTKRRTIHGMTYQVFE